MMSFSATNNIRKLMSAKKSPGQIHVLNGLRVFSMWWVILGHTLQFDVYRIGKLDVCRDGSRIFRGGGGAQKMMCATQIRLYITSAKTEIPNAGVTLSHKLTQDGHTIKEIFKFGSNRITVGPFGRAYYAIV